MLFNGEEVLITDEFSVMLTNSFPKQAELWFHKN